MCEKKTPSCVCAFGTAGRRLKHTKTQKLNLSTTEMMGSKALESWKILKIRLRRAAPGSIFQRKKPPFGTPNSEIFPPPGGNFDSVTHVFLPKTAGNFDPTATEKNSALKAKSGKIRFPRHAFPLIGLSGLRTLGNPGNYSLNDSFEESFLFFYIYI